MSEKLVISKLLPSRRDLLALAALCIDGFQMGLDQKHIQNALIPRQIAIVPLRETSSHFDCPLINQFRKINNWNNY
jgi:hypothetical protein